ncbi:hypothetical protein TruAng_003429 [Truncatella angustata]|nr:hypothetical protein TruAng_003429 [Truncatella angustata]
MSQRTSTKTKPGASSLRSEIPEEKVSLGDFDDKTKDWYEDATDSSSTTARMMLVQWLFAFALIGGAYWLYYDELRALLGV